jgi:hypothetical protein
MRRRTVLAGIGLALLAAGTTLPTAEAGQVSGTTTLDGTAIAGQPLTVRVTLSGAYPVVAYDYALVNRCWFGGRYAGPGDSSETYPLLGPWFLGPGGSASSTQVVDLTPVPAGSVCKVSVTRGGVTVKGSTTSYAVG